MNMRTIIVGEKVEAVSPKSAAPLFVLYDDLDAEASKAWLVDRMLGAGELSAFYGPPGCGKGVIIEDMALHIAAGCDWHGRAVARGSVVYIALERKRLVERRAIAFRNKHGLRNVPFAIVGGVYDFRDVTTAAQIAEICREVEHKTGQAVVLIVIDTVSRALAGGDENSPKDMGALVTVTAKLQEDTQAHILLVHHIPHDSDRLRGHGALLGAVDTTIAVANGGAARSARVVKANDSEEGEGISFTIDSVEISQDGTTAAVAVPADAPPPPTSVGPRLSANAKTMLAILQEAGRDGLLTEEWNARSRDAGIGARRRADLTDARSILKRAGLVREYADRWRSQA
ncbi:AAA family ATPase [Bradyrhizobium sp. CCBAU 53338]|uniref:AAA family ATPase n=1 Tax=Bradyrhizobium sp. CCBAU 53338 TaxID=1325111 RepID=UPI00188DA3ED|nr:AAA family ATPase [Bradyrhizobium sp. CCBAU 53338]